MIEKVWKWIAVAFLAVVFSTTGVTLEKTFQWDNIERCSISGASGCWPTGTTVELCSNGLCIPGLDGTTMPTAQYRMNIPVDYGDVIDAKVRAVAPAGYQCDDPPVPCPYSDWSNNIILTYPSPPSEFTYSLEKIGDEMAIAFVNASAFRDPTGSTSIAAPEIAVTAGNAIFVGISSFSGSNSVVTGVADTAGNTYVRAGNEEGGDANHRSSIWYSLNVTANANNIITASFTGSSQYRNMAVAQFSGIAATGAYDQASTIDVTGWGKTHTSTNTGTTTQANEVVIGWYVSWDSQATLSATAPTVLAIQYSTGYCALAYKIVSSTGAQSTTLTTTTNVNYAVQARTFKASKSLPAHITYPLRSFTHLLPR